MEGRDLVVNGRVVRRGASAGGKGHTGQVSTRVGRELIGSGGGGGGVEEEHVGGCSLLWLACALGIGLHVVVGVHEIKGLKAIRGLNF